LAGAIPIQLSSVRAVEIDGARGARGRGRATDAFRSLMEDHQVTVLCERGTGEDAGLYRASFYYAGKRVRLVVDADGVPRGPPEETATGLPAR
jgi:hypothetical protein